MALGVSAADARPPQIVLGEVTKDCRLGEMDVHVLRGVSMSVCDGELIAIMGSPGSGKSTLMNILGCVERPTSGAYWLDGRDTSSLAPGELAEIRDRALGFVFQNFGLFSGTSALEHVELPLVHPGIQERCVAIAQALAGRPRLILADEPTANLDSRTSGEVMAVFQALGRSGITVVLLTQDSKVAAYASRVIVLRDGLVLSDDGHQPGPSP